MKRLAIISLSIYAFWLIGVGNYPDLWVCITAIAIFLWFVMSAVVFIQENNKNSH